MAPLCADSSLSEKSWEAAMHFFWPPIQPLTSYEVLSRSGSAAEAFRPGVASKRALREMVSDTMEE